MGAVISAPNTMLHCGILQPVDPSVQSQASTPAGVSSSWPFQHSNGVRLRCGPSPLPGRQIRLCLPYGPVVDQRKQRGVNSGRYLVAAFVAFVPLGGIRKKTGTVRLAGKYLVCDCCCGPGGRWAETRPRLPVKSIAG